MRQGTRNKVLVFWKDARRNVHPMVISEIDMTPGGVARSGNMGQGASEAPEGAYDETPHRKPVHIM